MVLSDEQLETIYDEKLRRWVGPIQITPITARLAPPGTYRIRFSSERREGLDEDTGEPVQLEDGLNGRGPFLLSPAGQLFPE